MFYVYVGVPSIIGGGILLAFGFSLSFIKTWVILIGNTYGMILIMVMMGYGLASVPRKLWREGSAKTMMARVYMRAGTVETRLKLAEETFESVMLDVGEHEHRFHFMYKLF